MSIVQDNTSSTARPHEAEPVAAAPERGPQGATSPRVKPVPAAVAPAPKSPSSRRGLALTIGAIVALAALVFGVQHVLAGRHHVTTDDAQVEGHIVPVTAKVGGYVTAVSVSENQQVHAGDVLVQLDDRELKNSLAQADARLAAAQAVAGIAGQTGEANARLSAANANIQQAEVTARRAAEDLARYRALAEKNAVSRQQLDQAEAASATARAQLSAAHDQAAAASAATRTAGGQLQGASAARDEAQLQLTYTRIVAPLDGVVSRKSVEVGQLVQPGQQLMSVVPLTDIWAVANLKETQLRDVSPGDPAEIRVDSNPGVVHRAVVESISPATGAKFSLLPPDNATGNFTKVVQRVPVRLRFVEPNDPAHPLRPGMSVKVTIDTQGK
jgi:membrane fusion protein (multidrug efflux system)